MERTDLTIIEDLDWDHAPACEGKLHPQGTHGHDGGPAWALIHIACPTCAKAKYMYLCKGRWDAYFPSGRLECLDCDYAGPASDFWRFVALVDH